MAIPIIEAAVRGFRRRYRSAPGAVAFSPGRVNIIGEHTDYNDGFVLPCAIDLATAIAFRPEAQAPTRLYSDMVAKAAEFSYKRNEREGLAVWARYAWGVGMSLLDLDVRPDFFTGYSATTVPQGGGLSSSASFEVAVALACLGGRYRKVAKLDLVHIARRSENKYVGTNCGVMDQYACIFGQEGKAILLDCRSLRSRLIPFPKSAALVVADTGVRRVLGESGYHKRQEECSEASEKMAKSCRGVKNLRDVTLGMLEEKYALLGDVCFRRARHVVTENERVKKAVKAMSSGDVASLGRLMSESHVSLMDDFEVSCGELDVMVNAAQGLRGHCGTRMTGGGFGGCTVSLVAKANAAAFAAALAKRYEAVTGIEAVTRIVVPGRGAGIVEAF
jgi:galactokinase